MAYLLNTLLNLSAGLHKIHRRNSKTTMIRVHVPETKSSIYKGLKVCLQWKVLVAYPVSLHALHSNNSETSNANIADFVERVCNSEQQL